MPGETYRCFGVSASAKHHQLHRDLLIIIAMSKNSLTSPDADTPIRQYADPPTRFPSRRPILNATTSPLYARRYTSVTSRIESFVKNQICTRRTRSGASPLVTGVVLPEPVGSTLPRDRGGVTPGPGTNNPLWTTHGILTLIRPPFFSAFVRLNIWVRYYYLNQ
jgi:hypothetical protein